MFSFYYAGSKVTKFKADKKKRIEHDYKEGLCYLQVVQDMGMGWVLIDCLIRRCIMGYFGIFVSRTLTKMNL